MKTPTLTHFYYSGSEVADLSPAWLERHSALFCGHCHRLKFPYRPLELEVCTPIPKSADMFIVGHLLRPLVLSDRFMRALSTVEASLNVGGVYRLTGKNRRTLPFFSCTSKVAALPLRGRNPDIIGGKPVPEAERLVACEACGAPGRRERAPWYLLEDEIPAEPVFCSDLGLVVAGELGEQIANLGLRHVRIEPVEVV